MQGQHWAQSSKGHGHHTSNLQPLTRIFHPPHLLDSTALNVHCAPSLIALPSPTCPLNLPHLWPHLSSVSTSPLASVFLISQPLPSDLSNGA